MKKNDLAKNTILLGVGTVLTKGLLFVMVPFFSRWLSAEDYGTFDLLCTYATLMIPIISLACGEAIFRFSIDTNDKNDIDKYISNGLGIICINMALVSSIIFLIKYYTGWKMALPFLLLIIGEILNSHLQSFLRSIKKLNIYSLCNAFSVVLISILVTFFVKKLELGLSGIVYGYGLGYILGDLIIIMIAKYYNYLNLRLISFSEMKNLIKYSYPLIANSISWWIMNISDRLIINMVMGSLANGIYAISNKIPAICSSVFSVFNISWQQTASELINEGNIRERNRFFCETYNTVFKTLLSLCIGILSLNFIFFEYVFDSRYYEGRLYSPILITSIIFMILSQFYGGIQISLKMPKENGKTTVIGCLLYTSPSPRDLSTSRMPSSA